MLELRPILSALRRHKVAALLIALQLGLTLAIVGNATVVIQEHAQRMARPTGVAVADIVTAGFRPIPKDYDKFAAFRLDLDLIRALPSVVDATISDEPPLTGGGSYSSFQTAPNQQTGIADANYFTVDEHFISALGMRLIAGRTFTAAEIQRADSTANWQPGTAIITQQLAGKLFPRGEVLGKSIYLKNDDKPVRIVGIVERNLGSWPNWSSAGNAVFYPVIRDGQWVSYIVRAEPGQRNLVQKRLEKTLAERDPRRVITVKTLEEQRDRYFAGDSTMATVLSAVVGLLTSIVALGIAGLTAFWITQRQQQTGIRRALGASRGAICRYFLLENLMIAATGLLLGTAAAQLVNHFLSGAFGQPALPPGTTIACGLILLGISLAAALAPALRAANISPATATRSV
ncbi:FtsX-like permease family protein [Microbulbifer sp. SAOS-129_SWC]|uniref:ABC transporter permease n=1 Tax=Microbulbifer sp. SAOS-129_SWC TaxID=3145235 RepID=UPI003217493C